MSRKPCLYDQVTLADGSEGIIKFIGSLSGKDDLYYGVDLTVLGKHKYNNIDGTMRNIQYFATSNGKNGRLCKPKSLKYYKLTGDSIQLTYGSKIYIESAYCDGIIKYIGIPPDQSNEYIGVELEEDNGDTDGTYKSNGAQYFQCANNYGIYVPLPSNDSIQSSKGSAKQNDDKKIEENTKPSYAKNADTKVDTDGNKTYTTGTKKNKVVTTVMKVNSGIDSGNTGGSVKDRMSLWNNKTDNDNKYKLKTEKERQLRTSQKLMDKAMVLKLKQEKEKEDKIRQEQSKKAEQIKKDKLERQKQRKEENEKQKREQQRLEKEKLEQEKRERQAAEKAKKQKLEKEKRKKEAAETTRKQEEKRKREAAEKVRKEKLERERAAAEQSKKEKSERKKREREEAEKTRKEQEKRKRDAAEKSRKEKLEREKQQRLAAEKARKEKLEREKQQKQAAEKAKKEEEERKKRQAIEKERLRKEGIAKREKEAKEKATKLKKEKREREEKERKRKELEIQKEKLEKERIEKEKIKREEKEKKEREAKERIRRQKEQFEKKEKEKKQKLEKEQRLKASRERAEKIRKEKEEKAKKEREEKLKLQKEKEKKQREEKQKREQEAKIKAEKEAKAKAEKAKSKPKQVVSSGVDSGSIYNKDDSDYEQYFSDDDDGKNAAEMRRKQEEEEEAELARQIMERKKRRAEEEKKKAANKSNNNNNNKNNKKGGNDELMDMMSQMNDWKNKNNNKNSNASQFKRKGKHLDSGLKGTKGRKFSNAPKAKKNYSRKDLENELKSSIGKDIHKITMVKLDQYEGDIPLVLYLLGNELYKCNKFGTFKLFEPEEMQNKKHNNNVCNLAWNIYLFFSSLPIPLLHTISQQILMKAINKDVMKDVIHAMDEPYASTLVYLWDILAKVAMESKSSRMGQQQLGKVFGPMVTMVTQEDVKGNRVSMNVLAASRMMAMFRRGIEWRMQVAGFNFDDSSDDDSD